MSFQAKSNLAMLTILGLVYGGYFVIVLRWASQSPIDDIVWQPLMLVTVLPLTVLSIVAHIIIAVVSPSGAGGFDERDRLVDLRGEWLGSYVLALGVFGGLGLAMFEANSFWVGQVLLGGLVLSEITKDVRTLMLYRQGT